MVVVVLVGLALLVYCVLSVVATPEEQVQRLPKAAWLLLVLLVPLAGPLAWLLAGREDGAPRTRPYVRGAARTGTAMSSPDDDETFLRSLRDRADEQRRRAERERRAGGDPGPASLS